MTRPTMAKPMAGHRMNESLTMPTMMRMVAMMSIGFFSLCPLSVAHGEGQGR